MMLADPRLVKAELIEPLDQFEIALKTLGRVFFVRMKRRQKDTVPQIDLAHARLALVRSADATGFGRKAKLI